jgi:hypothetical protein
MSSPPACLGLQMVSHETRAHLQLFVGASPKKALCNAQMELITLEGEANTENKYRGMDCKLDLRRVIFPSRVRE